MAYSKQTWVRGEKVASAKLNHMEDGIDAISANGAIGTANLANASVTNAKLDQGAVDTSNIANGAVGTTEIQDGAVTTPKIAGGAVTTAKISDGAVTDAKLAQSGGVLSEVADLKSVVNHINDAVGLQWDEGHFINGSGAYVAASDRACTDFIPCEPFVSITYVGENNHANVYGISFYDEIYQIIGGDKNNGNPLGTPTTVTSPANTSFCRVSTKISILDDSYIAFNGQRNSAVMSAALKALKRTVYVDSVNGSDSNMGNLGNPFKTLSHALGTGAEDIGILSSTIITEEVSVSNKKRLHLFTVPNTYVDSTTPYRVRAKFNGDDFVATILTFENVQNLILEDLEIYGCTGDGCLINKCENVLCTNCSFHGNGNNGVVINYTNGVFRRCLAFENDHDGFNLNYYGDTQFYDCSGWDNGDDGISHHQGTTGMIVGGEWYGNTKGGVASPCHGAIVDIFGIYSHNNGYGIYANCDAPNPARTFRVWNCVLTENNYGLASGRNTAIIYGNKISGNTTSQTTAPNGGSIITL